MQHYLKQLHADIEAAIARGSFSLAKEEVSIHDWISDQQEDATAPLRNLCEWTGITPEMLPPAGMLNEKEMSELLETLKRLLGAYNCHFVLQTEVPEDIQYEVIRVNLNQQVKVKYRHMGFFEMCTPGTPLKKCALGDYCQCAFFEDFVIGREMKNEK